MINLLNKILSRFNLKLVSTKPDTRLVDETVKFLNRTEYSGGLCGVHDVDITKEIPHDYYVGDIGYLQKAVKGEFPQVSGKTYFRQVLGKEYKYFDYDGDTYTTEQLQEKLNETL
jgi:hypothetical protein